MGCGSSRTNEGPIDFVAKPPALGKFFKTQVENKSLENVLETVLYGTLKEGLVFSGALYSSEKELENLRDMIPVSDDDEVKNKKHDFNFEKFRVVAVGGCYVNKVVASGDSYILHQTKDKPSQREYVALVVAANANVKNWVFAEATVEGKPVLVLKVGKKEKEEEKEDQPAEDKKETVQPIINVNVNINQNEVKDEGNDNSEEGEEDEQ